MTSWYWSSVWVVRLCKMACSISCFFAFKSLGKGMSKNKFKKPSQGVKRKSCMDRRSSNCLIVETIISFILLSWGLLIFFQVAEGRFVFS